MDREPIWITCKKCKISLGIKGMVRHAMRSHCKSSYNADHVTSLKEHSKQLSSAKRKIRDAVRYQRRKIELSQKHLKNYDKLKRAQLF